MVVTLVAAAPVVAVVAAVGLTRADTGDSGVTSEAGLGEAQRIAVTSSSCGAGWSLPTTGAAAFVISNTAGRSAEVTLRSAADDGVVAEIEGLPTGITRQLSTTVNPGSYYWMCQFRGAPSTRSDVVKVAGPTVPVAEPLLQVTADDMQGPVLQYRAYVAGQMALLRTQTATLRADLAAGNAAKAKSDWLVAHETYHRVGAAYDAFGDDGDRVDGLTEGLPDGAADKDFTGFHKIEKLLWSGADPRSIVPQADELARAVVTLVTKLPSFTFDPNDISVRTHEILEGTARFQLTGQDDYGSGSSLATADADIDGTRTLVKILGPLLETRAKGLPARLNHALDVLQSAVRATRSQGAWVPVAKVSRAQRQAIDAAAGGALESLSAVPEILEIRG